MSLNLDTILSALGPVGTLIVVLAWLLKELVLDRNRGAPMAREDRELLMEIRGDVKYLKLGNQKLWSRQDNLESRLDDHLEHHVGRNTN